MSPHPNPNITRAPDGFFVLHGTAVKPHPGCSGARNTIQTAASQEQWIHAGIAAALAFRLQQRACLARASTASQRRRLVGTHMRSLGMLQGAWGLRHLYAGPYSSVSCSSERRKSRRRSVSSNSASTRWLTSSALHKRYIGCRFSLVLVEGRTQAGIIRTAPSRAREGKGLTGEVRQGTLQKSNGHTQPRSAVHRWPSCQHRRQPTCPRCRCHPSHQLTLPALPSAVDWTQLGRT